MLGTAWRGVGYPTAILCAALYLAPSPAVAAVSEPDGRAEHAFDVMNWLAEHHGHDLHDERWNAYGQFTWISSFKKGFSAPYTNLGGSNKSLHTGAEHSFTGTATAYAGLRLWRGAELYVVPEVISERPLSELAGLGGAIQNFELQKTGSTTPSLYLSRIFLRQTLDLGGASLVRSSDPMQLGGQTTSRRVVITAGNFSILDIFDKNAYAGDLRRQFLNMAFLTHAAYDFAADARGYSWGLAAEAHWDDWTLRLARLTPPLQPNQLELDFRLHRYYGDQVELEHRHSLVGRPGTVRLIGYRNRENIGRFAAATAALRSDPAKNAAACSDFNYGSTNANAPDLCWVRAPGTKVGGGFSLEQEVAGGLGLFARGMISDGQSEVYSYTSADRSASAGLLALGGRWGRPNDVAGLGWGSSWISREHAAFLAAGGVDGFVGDGALDAAGEHVVDVFYAMGATAAIWFTADYQHIWHPGFNAARGPVHVAGFRAHAEF